MLGHLILPAFVASGAVFDPSTLDLSVWLRASYSGSPWTGTASAGNSGSHNFSNAGNAPSAGTAVNSLTPADFDGVNDTLNGGNLSDVISAGAYTVGVVCKLNSISTSVGEGAFYDNIHLVGQQSSVNWALSVRDATGAYEATIGHWNGGAYNVKSCSISLSTWQFIQARWNGTTLEIRNNGGTWQTVAASNAATGGTVWTGADRNSTAFLDGDILEIIASDTALSDSDLDDYRTSYLLDRYGLSL